MLIRNFDYVIYDLTLNLSRIPGLDSSHPSHPPPHLSASNQSSPLGLGRGQQQGNGHSYLPSMMSVAGGIHYRHPASSDIYAQVGSAATLVGGFPYILCETQEVISC